jgi:hypothetical protein
MTKTQEIALYRMIEPIDEQTYRKEQDGAFDDSTDNRSRRFELRLNQREIARDTHDKQEEGEHQVAWSHTIPLGMLERLKRLAPAIIHENHPCNSNAS